MKRIGITTTVPVEVILAAGAVPVDLNNLFVSDGDPASLIAAAERAGFPLNTCAWIKGIYGATLKYGIEEVICVTGGDCSNTLMLMEVLRHRGVKTIPFAYPGEPDQGQVKAAIETLAFKLGTTADAAESVRQDLASVRAFSSELDRMTWQDNKVSGKENHYWLVSSSDFNQDVKRFSTELSEVINEAAEREPHPPTELRLGFAGVPPIYAAELYPFLERCAGRVVFNEVQRQFSMPYKLSNLTEQYCRYTYPYETSGRVSDIRQAIKERRLDGVIHYVQSFCHRAIGDIIIRSELDVPVLTIEGNADFGLSQHLRTRLEAFLDVVRFQRRSR
ncbi:Benzoyl-CoA reductase/2-hydroxyglutaryl-CoA dehydratase subunit, BcrC/BadD/HgdB [Dehalogenimonas formicexedens]|uniref:Benzoyl-CoA reductase/2-hydroxyglutaryl-CoA dehydratase subunit, BcrC/BadD/HgdB n=1 Tax=Dehalogenimonas formicexedens TaxID=1839801 RepID=A0A1P8F7H0_9CHLR|nr:2-hydroxyacyl-CoA dehydratase [Dehalogenimonas formicexedens]APV44312.1 Benzoyl-CoA reductase/2-hydroxyglutaryl-CoA dehydratase subunit, BcrC/BadD/HgdB [Dehalogenimonas formicexedens]